MHNAKSPAHSSRSHAQEVSQNLSVTEGCSDSIFQSIFKTEDLNVGIAMGFWTKGLGEEVGG